MALISFSETLYLILGFAFFMIAATWWRSSKNVSSDAYLVAERNLPTWRGAFSIAVSWVWAPAIFIASMQAYTKGLPGIFWFTIPNILCFFLFAVIAVKLRTVMPYGYSLPDYIAQKYPNNRLVHVMFLIIAFGYQVFAIIINAVAGGTLLNLASGLDIKIAIFSMVAIALAYSLPRGLKASVFTDIIQLSMILIFGFILIPWSMYEVGGMSSITDGIAGVTGTFGNIFDPSIAFSMGIPMAVSLLAGPISDQMFHQRAMAVQKNKIKHVFIFGGLLFGLVPITLSLLGFIGVTLTNEIGLMIEDPQMIAPLVINALLPKAALYLFVLMAFAGLCSTMDSAFCAMSSLGAIDIFKRYIKKDASNHLLLNMRGFP